MFGRGRCSSTCAKADRTDNFAEAKCPKGRNHRIKMLRKLSKSSLKFATEQETYLMTSDYAKTLNKYIWVAWNKSWLAPSKIIPDDCFLIRHANEAVFCHIMILSENKRTVRVTKKEEWEKNAYFLCGNSKLPCVVSSDTKAHTHMPYIPAKVSQLWCHHLS